VKLSFFILCNVVLFGVASPALAENESPYFARTWLAEDGLPDNRVVGLAQTADGYLWVATQGGVVRFDGVRFQRVSFARFPGLIAGTMRVLILDQAGRIWLAKEEGGTLFCFDGAQVQMLTSVQGLPQNAAQSSMALDDEGCLWITYSTGEVIRYNKSGKVDVFTAKDGLPGDGVCWLVCDRKGTLWFAKGSHVGVYRDGRFNVLQKFGSAALRIAAARAGGIWVCAGQQVLKFDENIATVELGKIIPNEAGSRSSFEPSVLLEDHEGAVWVGTVSAGLYRCDGNTVTKVEVSNPAILSLTEDREDNLWVGTRGGGLNRVHRCLTSMIKPADGFPFQGVQSVCQDATGALWLVGDNGVLVRGQGANWTVQSPSGGLLPVHVTCAAADTIGSVWIGTWGGGLYNWADGQFNDLRLQAGLHQKSPRSLLVMHNGDLWIGTDSPAVLNRLRGGKLQEFALPPGRRFIRAMAEDAVGNFWAGASDGMLLRVTGDALVDETAKSSSLSIRCLHAETNGDLWIGYGGAGVGRLRNGSVTRFSTDQGLPNDFVAQILTDNHGSVWFAGNQGIFRVREQDFDDLAKGLDTRVWPVVYGRNEGLPGLQASFDFCPDSLRASDDRLFFSMLTGLAEVQPDRVHLNQVPPIVIIERVVADDQILAAYQASDSPFATNAPVPAELASPGSKNEIRLPAGLQHVQFEFTALSFVAPEDVQFRYQLEGLDRGWVDAGTRRSAQYSHLPPGQYRFKVMACNNDHVWNDTGAVQAVIMEPHIWETLWFKMLVATAAFGIFSGTVAVVLRHRHRLQIQRLEELRTLERERARIARDLHDDLGLGLTEIGLLGDLASVPAATRDASRGYLQEITGRARDLVVLLDEIVWAINPVNDTSQSLSDYFFIYGQTLLHRASIRCRLEVIEPFPNCGLNAEERHQLFLAFKEALNNVIRHSGATEVRISLAMQDGHLMIGVTDNGHGLEETAAEGSRDGLTGMQERLLRLGGRCEIAAIAGGGMSVKLLIPIGQKRK
jgi:ligand-binding sensor domain-containing protein/signal transduction histidine kinase